MNAQNVFIVAEQFEHTANTLARQIPTSGPTPPVTPFVVNATFAIEMYLKCLYIVETRKLPKKTHELHTLFNMLDSKSRASILKYFDEQMANDPTINVMLSQFPDRKIDIKSVLLGMNNAFKDWRYSSIEGMVKSSIIGTDHIIVALKKRIIYLQSK